jgi:uncharacterized protein YegL
MSDLVSKNKIGIKSNSLHARIAEKELLNSVAPEQANVNLFPNRLTLMIDCSSSMSGDSIKLLESAVQDFIQKSNPSDTAIAIESFPEQIRIELTDDKTKLWFMTMGLKADGGTPMVNAMEYCLKNYSATRAIIISDGQPNDEPGEELLTQYKRNEIAIDTVHIGSFTGGEDCLKRISEATGGLFVKFKDVKQFANAFAYLLPETRANASSLLLTSGANEVR